MSGRKAIKPSTRYPDELAEVKRLLQLAQVQLLAKAASMTRSQIDRVMQHTKRISRLKKFSSVIDIGNEMLLSAEELSPGSIARMRPFIEPYRALLDRVRCQERKRVGYGAGYQAPKRSNAPEVVVDEQAAE